jgi:Type I restriction enzyme R protein N terminus (HSDR_N)
MAIDRIDEHPDLLSAPTASTTVQDKGGPLGTRESDARTKKVSGGPRHREPKWKWSAKQRVRDTFRHYAPQITLLATKKANEEQTRLLVTEFLCSALGFGRFDDLDLEFRVRGNYADYGLKIDNQLIAFVEVKAAATPLSERHLRQVKGYVLDDPDVDWAILTNGSVWRAYHIEAAKPVDVELVLEVNLLDQSATTAELADALWYMTKESFKHGSINDLWKLRRATSPRVMASTLVSHSVTQAIRAELHRVEGHLVEIEEIADILKRHVIRRDILEGC